MSRSLLEDRVREFLAQSGHLLDRQIGMGQDGVVWISDRGTVVKALEREANFYREASCYQRLKEHSIAKVHGFSIPKLLRFDARLMVIEMDLVVPPYLLDFGKAYLDEPPEFSAETWRDWRAEKQELFGARWPMALKVTSALRQFGIYYYDVTPGNVRFGDE